MPIDPRLVAWEDPAKGSQSIDPKLVQWAQSPPPAAPTLSGIDKFSRGLRDPIDAGAQLLTNILPEGVVQVGNRLNNWISDKTGLVGRLPEGGVDQQVREGEKAYQQARRAQGEDGIDGYRLLGNIANPANLAIASRIPVAATLAGRVGVGAAAGAGSGALTPVGEGDFSDEKLKQMGAGLVSGGAIPMLTGAASRVISPNAMQNKSLQLLRAEGVNPTIGQSLGGWANRMEEKAQSVPIMGDAIMAARRRSLGEFNKAAINRATGKVGGDADDIGHAGVKSAGDKISDVYESAKNSMGHFQLDSQGLSELGQLKQMAANLPDKESAQFEKLWNLVQNEVSPNGSFLAESWKRLDSKLGTEAGRFSKASDAYQNQLGDAITELKSIIFNNAKRANPAAAEMIDSADAAWANLVRVEGAAKAAKNADGVFTPAQLNSAIQGADKSVRGRAMARGTALMQDLGTAGQSVLGNKYPESGTAGRLMLGGAGLASGLANPSIPAALFGGAAMYMPQVQAVLNAALSKRPSSAGLLSGGIRNSMPYLLPGSGQVGSGLLDEM